MEKTYKIKPLKWYHDDEGNTHEATGVNYYHISEDTDDKVCTLYIFDDAGDFIRDLEDVPTVEEAKKICEDHYFTRMTNNLIEL